ncbi:amidohydrolase [Rubrivirga sp. S365]|uniref:amidohydrolase n=1 Tax=Rubrivirga sp. S365 TaxID=3076080 RepID=UPI0028C51340|nr:amidohydrolase [Rubrivirga sp. S365]MDT7855448.1 amidohydrolase [Rubrivirga sp. S365]
MTKLLAALAALALLPAPARAQADGPPRPDLAERVDALVADVVPDVVAYRRHIHENPELSNRETETAAYVAEHLTGLGMEVRTGVARTGVVGVLTGGKPGPTVALRADMDALPVTERVDLPFASTVTTIYNGMEVGVMHACGHDAHVGILMGVAEVLAAVRDELPGTVVFLFQPAEEGAPAGEAPAGAELMVAEGALSGAEAVFGLHVTSAHEVGQLKTRPGGMMASADNLEIVVHGKQTHGAYPWGGVDPVATSALVVTGLQTIVSRQMDLTKAPAVVTIGRIDGGVRSNIIPDSVAMIGTIRALDDGMRAELHDRIRRTATDIASSQGATATVTIADEYGYPVTANNAALLDRMAPTLQRVAGDGLDTGVAPVLGAEDFSYFANEVPGLFLWLGVRTPGASDELFPPNHSPLFRIDEDALPLGVRTLAQLAVGYLEGDESAGR